MIDAQKFVDGLSHFGHTCDAGEKIAANKPPAYKTPWGGPSHAAHQHHAGQGRQCQIARVRGWSRRLFQSFRGNFAFGLPTDRQPPLGGHATLAPLLASELADAQLLRGFVDERPIEGVHADNF